MSRAVLELEQVAAGHGAEPLFSGLDLRLAAGEVVALLGPNGAGKSTLLALIGGLHPLLAGELRLEGRPLAELGRRRIARTVAVVPQQPTLPPGYTVEEMVAMGRAPHIGFPAGFLRGPGEQDQRAVAEALARCDLEAFRDRRLETLSGGEAQRVVLARALAQQPRLLLLDEPTSHLDLRYQLEVLRLARRAAADGVAVLAVLHDLNLAVRACDRLLLLAGGGLLADGPPGEALDEAMLRAAYGGDLELRWVDGLPTVLPGRMR